MKRLGSLLLATVLIWSMVPAAAAEAPEYDGKAYILMDAATGTILKAYNEHEALPPASVTKIMTLLLIFEAIDSGQLKWEDTITASDTAAAKGGSQVYLRSGETMSVTDMVKSIAVSSANDCACAMAETIAGSEAAFVEKMNRRAKELGMLDTHFVNCTGLDDHPDAKSHRTSAHDIAIMSRELLMKHPKVKEFTTIWMDSIRDGAFGLSNTNKLVRFYAGCTGLKTGYTSTAGFCLSASAKRENLELIAVVLGGTSSQNRFTACRQMLDYGFANYALYTPELSTPPTVPVRMGQSKEVAAVPKELMPLLVQRAEVSGITLDATVQPELSAPVTKGEQIGTLTIQSGEKTLAQIPLVAEQDVPRLTWLDLFQQLLGYVAMAG